MQNTLFSTQSPANTDTDDKPFNLDGINKQEQFMLLKEE